MRLLVGKPGEAELMRKWCTCLSPNFTWLECESWGEVTYVLVRNNFNVLHVSSSLENLPQDLLGHPRVKTANVQSSFVGLGSRAPDGAASAHGRTKTIEAVGIRHIHRERVVVLGNVEAERRLGGHALAVAIFKALRLPSLTRHATHGRRHGELRRGTVVIGHCDGFGGGKGGGKVKCAKTKWVKSRQAELTVRRLLDGEEGSGRQ
jgi:hypothetical protein